jgi:hypothetical protein
MFRQTSRAIRIKIKIKTVRPISMDDRDATPSRPAVEGG